MRKGTIELQKIVAWTLGVLLALVIIFIIITYMGDGDKSLVQQILDKLKIFN